ncbi:MAG: amidohydrolase family protein [Chloroflexi bacterium]|nr:amidohydrolase family protein [Chloroflexota bacterium]MDA1147020.1 amidohydrolase family protein [Chloroflexota bacterium]
MIWDVHCHFPRNWQDPDNFDPAKEIDARADALRAAGVTRASLLCGGRFGMAYDESLTYARRHEDLFLPSAMIDPEEIKHSDIRELHEQGYRGLKMIGVRKPYDDYTYFGVYQAAEELDMPILMHMGVIGGGVDYSITHPRRDPEAAQRFREMKNSPRARGRDVSATRMRPFHMDTIANNFPDLKLIGAHMGGTGNYDEAASVTRWRHNVYLDMSGGETIERHAVERRLVGHEIGVEKLTWGSDCGNEEIADHVANLERIFDQVGLTDDERNRIRYQNAAEIFGEAEPIHAAE